MKIKQHSSMLNIRLCVSYNCSEFSLDTEYHGSMQYIEPCDLKKL